MQHRSHDAHLYTIGRGRCQADEMPVIELAGLGRSLVRIDGRNEQRAAYGFGGCSVGHLSKLDQEPTRMITNRPHREDPRAALVAQDLAGREAPLGLISPQFDCHFTAYAVGAADDSHNDGSVQLLAPLAADRARSPPTSSSFADEKRVRSLLLSTAARDPMFNCSLASPPRLPAPATAAATSDLVDIDEVDA